MTDHRRISQNHAASRGASAPTASVASRSPSPREPERTCVGCRDTSAQAEMVRVVRDGVGGIVVDVSGRVRTSALGAAPGALGRGAWIHPKARCVELAAGQGLARSFKAELGIGPAALTLALRAAADRRVRGLLMAARRAGKLAVGTSDVREKLDRAAVRLLVLTTDARAAAQEPAVERWLKTGPSAAWGSKELMGQIVGRSEVAVVAVLDNGLAEALSRTIEMVYLPGPTADGATPNAYSEAG